MKTYEVTLPVHGVAYATVEVEDDTDGDAIYSAAVEQINKRIDEEEFLSAIEQIDFPKKIIEGNFHLDEFPLEFSFEEVPE